MTTMSGEGQAEYRYLQEISQMMFVFGDVVDPHTDVLKLVEDIVRNQVIEMLLQSRALAARRSSRFLSPEDLIFLIRYDRAKVNRLRTYLSWKDVRKNAKDSGGDAAGGGGGGSGGGGGGGDVADGGEDGVENPIKSRKMKIKLPWELSTIYSEYLGGPGGEDREEEDEDDIEAHEDSLQRLKDADEATRRMTRDEYVHYSECRQASFTFRKSKKFREFINAGAYLDVKPNDDIIDVLGFLAFEVVRELCVGAVALKQSLEEESAHIKRLREGSKNRKSLIENGHATTTTTTTTTTTVNNGENNTTNEGEGATATIVGVGDTSIDTAKGSNTSSSIEEKNNGSASMKRKLTQTSANGTTTTTFSTNGNKKAKRDASPLTTSTNCGLFAMPPAKASPLMTSHVREAFARLQRDRSALSTGTGGIPGGLKRTRVFVI